jgi:hypothetical protein
MRIIGCDLHARQQTIAMLDDDTGEVVEQVQPRASSQCARFPDACCRPFRTGRHGARASPTRARHRVCGASRTVRRGTASTGGSADRGVDQPAREDNDRPGCPGSTIGMSDDLRVDPIHDADDHSAIMLIDRGATLRQHLLVQDSQDGKPS